MSDIKFSKTIILEERLTGLQIFKIVQEIAGAFFFITGDQIVGKKSRKICDNFCVSPGNPSVPFSLSSHYASVNISTHTWLGFDDHFNMLYTDDMAYRAFKDFVKLFEEAVAKLVSVD